RTDRSRAIGDDENIEPKAPRYAVDLLTHWARITINVNVSQLPARFDASQPTPWAYHPPDQPLPQLRPPPPCPRSLDGDRQCLSLSDEHHQPLAARHAGVDQVPLQHRVMLGAERNHDGWVLRSLALVDRRRVGKNQLVEFGEAVDHLSTVEVDRELALLHIDAQNEAEVTVVDLLVVVVLN